MRISTSTIRVVPIRISREKPLGHAHQRGFTLIEILVALALVALVITIALPSGGNSRVPLEETLDHLERSIRFGTDEAILRNVVVRLNFSFNEDPQLFTIEYGPDAQFVPPPRPDRTRAEMGSSEQEAFDEELAQLNRQFNRIRELAQGRFEIPETVVLMGVGLVEDQNLTMEAEASIYMYPTGEKDHAFVLLSSDDEYVVLEIQPYTMNFRRTFIRHEHDFDLERRYRESNDIFRQWSQRP